MLQHTFIKSDTSFTTPAYESETTLIRHRTGSEREYNLERSGVALLEAQEQTRRLHDEYGESIKQKLAMKASSLVRAQIPKENGRLLVHIGHGLYCIGFLVNVALTAPVFAAKQGLRGFQLARCKLAWYTNRIAAPVLCSLGFRLPVTLPWSAVERLETAERFDRIERDKVNPERIIVAAKVASLIAGIATFNPENDVCHSYFTHLLEEAERERRIAQVKHDSDITAITNGQQISDMLNNHRRQTMHNNLKSARPELEEVVVKGPLMSRNTGARETVRLYREMARPAAQAACTIDRQAPVAVVVPKARSVGDRDVLAENLAEQGTTVIVGKAAM